MKYLMLAIAAAIFLRGLAALVWPDWHLQSTEDHDAPSDNSRRRAYIEGTVMAFLGGCGLWAILFGPGGPVDPVP